MRDRILRQYKQYSLFKFIKKIFKFILRKTTSFNYNRYYYLGLDIDSVPVLENKAIKILELKDFKKGEKVNFTKDKLKLYATWLSDGTHIPYGIIKNNVLVYSCWISLKYLYVAGEKKRLKEEEALLLDDYCHSEYRGQGLHTLVTPYRLSDIKRRGKRRAVVLILKGNIPAYKVMIKSNFVVLGMYTKTSFLNKNWLKFKGK